MACEDGSRDGVADTNQVSFLDLQVLLGRIPFLTGLPSTQSTSDAVPDTLLVSSLATTAFVQLASYCLVVLRKDLSRECYFVMTITKLDGLLHHLERLLVLLGQNFIYSKLRIIEFHFTKLLELCSQISG